MCQKDWFSLVHKQHTQTQRSAAMKRLSFGKVPVFSVLALSVVGLLYALIDRFILEGWCKIRSLQFKASLAVTCINALTIIPYTCMAYSYAVCRHSKKPSEGDL